MPKKIIDIMPPGIESSGRKKKSAEVLPESGAKPSFKIFFSKKFYLIIAFLALAGAAAFFSQSRAEIRIFPATEDLTFETKLSVASNGLAELAGVIFEEEKTVTKEFLATGKKVIEKKAEGTIRIYNNYHSSQALVANTRLQATLEKFQPALEKDEKPWFRIVSAVTIPAKSYVDVKVVADSSGEKYNIKSSKFSVPGLAGTPQYTLIYGESFQDFQGGSRKESPQISAADLAKAKDEISQIAKEASVSQLKEKIPADFTYFEDAFKTEALETFSISKALDESEKFNYQAKAKAKTMAVKKTDSDNFAKEFVLSEIGDKKIDEKNLKINYSLYSIDNQLNKMMLALDIDSIVYSLGGDEDLLKKNLSGKSLADAKYFLENQSGSIKEAKIKVWPFWANSLPKDLTKIKIFVNI
ncbi:MAG: hypothetical protein V1705_01580 [bacterium]